MYYPYQELSVKILNFISKNEKFTSEENIISHINTVLADDRITDIVIKEEIVRLQNDGYLIREIRNDERTYNYKFSLLKLWWKTNKS